MAGWARKISGGAHQTYELVVAVCLSAVILCCLMGPVAFLIPRGQFTSFPAVYKGIKLKGQQVSAAKLKENDVKIVTLCDLASPTITEHNTTIVVNTDPRSVTTSQT